MSRQPLSKRHSIPRLHKYGAGPRKLAHETLARSKIAYDTPASNALENVLAVPSNEVTVVDDVLLVGGKLYHHCYYNHRLNGSQKGWSAWGIKG